MTISTTATATATQIALAQPMVILSVAALSVSYAGTAENIVFLFFFTTAATGCQTEAISIYYVFWCNFNTTADSSEFSVGDLSFGDLKIIFGKQYADFFCEGNSTGYRLIMI